MAANESLGCLSLARDASRIFDMNQSEECRCTHNKRRNFIVRETSVALLGGNICGAPDVEDFPFYRTKRPDYY